MKAWNKGYLTLVNVFLTFTVMDIFTLLNGGTVSDGVQLFNIVVAAFAGLGVYLSERE